MYPLIGQLTHADQLIERLAAARQGRSMDKLRFAHPPLCVLCPLAQPLGWATVDILF